MHVRWLAYGAHMTYTVLESLCEAKYSSSTTVPGDDVLHLTPGFAALIDGAGSWSGRLNGLARGRFAALAVAKGLNLLDAEADVVRAASHLSRVLKNSLGRATLEGELVRPPTCVAAIYSVSRREVWLVGDCQALIFGQHHQFELPTDQRAAAFRQAFLKALILSGKGLEDVQAGDPSWALLKPVFEAAPADQNHPLDSLGYGAFDGQEIPACHLHVVPVPQHVHEVILASDGYPELHATLAESEEALWALARRDPLMIGDSPGCRAFPVTGGSFDDRTYLRLRLS